MRCVLVSTTGKFFNKVNQAESLRRHKAPCGIGELCVSKINCSVVAGFNSPLLQRVVIQHCDLSVTTSGGHTF